MTCVPRNALLLEAVDDQELVNRAVKDIKKQMNICKLAKFKSADSNSKFYSSFFTCSLESGERPTTAQWGSIYTTLLSDDAFCGDLAKYILVYQPPVYTGMFAPLWNSIQSDIASMKKNKIRYMSMQKAMVTMIHMRLNGVGNMIKSQVSNAPEATKFITVIDQVLSRMVFDLNQLISAEMLNAAKPDDLVVTVRQDLAQPYSKMLPEDAVELIQMLENGQEWIAARASELNEGIVGDAVETVKGAMLASKKAERDFDEKVMGHVRRMREERRNRKHSEMVGESLRVMNEIKRVLKAGAIGLLNPTWGVIAYLVSIIADRSTDIKDRQVLANQLRDELEIIEEKINMAERKGDDKARIELIRFRQKLQHEYERIMHVRYSAKVRNKLGIGGYE